jgi:cell wall-associated NlpC family hydrolase
MPLGTSDSLLGLDDLARIQRGDGGTQQAAARQLELTQITAQLALDEQTLTEQRYTELAQQYNKLNAELTRKQTAQQAFELAHADELSAAEASQSAADSRLGAQYLAGAEAGRGADARALQALAFALAQRGDPYGWSEEGPNQYDCSGLMYAAYRSVGYPLDRVSRDQYLQTQQKVVDRYSLLPGDLLFFSYSNSWRGIHHVAMYAGNGMMVEAPRTGLNVRLTPVRWSRLFQATRVFGSVEGVTEGPELGSPDADPTTANPGTGTPTTAPTTKPAPTPTTKPTTKPPTTPPTTTPPTTTPPTTTPPTTTPPTTTPPTTTPPTTSDPTTAPAPTTSAPADGGSSDDSSPGESSSADAGSSPSTSSATATEAASASN